jgi:hypothetical protein
VKIKVALAFFIVLSLATTMAAYIFFVQKIDAEAKANALASEYGELMRRHTNLKQQLPKHEPQ